MPCTGSEFIVPVSYHALERVEMLPIFLSESTKGKGVWENLSVDRRIWRELIAHVLFIWDIDT
jgi:hypothetical protein